MPGPGEGPSVVTVCALAEAPVAATGAWGYRSYREHLARLFPGQRIRKLCLQAGFTCPNLDGQRGRAGCTYCNNHGFAPGLSGPEDLLAQWNRGRRALRRRHRRVDGFIAYFQSFSNTYAPLDQLRRLYDPLPAALPECRGLALGTRPDCLPDPVLDYLAERARECYLCLEIGLQSDRDRVLRAINRGHGVAEFLDAVARASARGIELCMHVILGLPDEGADAPERLGRLAADLPVRSIKVHNLHIMRGTRLARAWQRGAVPDWNQARYVDAAARLIAELRPDQCVQRAVADAPDRLLLSGGWCQRKQDVLASLAERLHTQRLLHPQGSHA